MTVFWRSRLPEWFKSYEILKGKNNVTDKEAEYLLAKGDTKFNLGAKAQHCDTVWNLSSHSLSLLFYFISWT